MLSFAVEEPENFTLVLFQQADGVVFRVSLEVDDAEQVGADGEMHAGLFALDQHRQPGVLELRLRDLVVA